ncbi:thioredoxin [Kineococcus glutinatus]|uniref:Thioredoxin n=1 Tax=Kineococcus glutinatus TaxID=1070872 RepID=A0ABP9H720_9ACTN
MGATQPVTDDTFETVVLKSDKPVLVDFWAPWCGPCRQVAPILEEIAAEHGEQLQVVKINTDENPQTAARYGVTSIPTLNVYSGGEVVKTIIGARPKPALLRELAEFTQAQAPTA